MATGTAGIGQLGIVAQAVNPSTREAEQVDLYEFKANSTEGVPGQPVVVKASLGKNKQGKTSWDTAGSCNIWQEILGMHYRRAPCLQPPSTCCHQQIPMWRETLLGEGV